MKNSIKITLLSVLTGCLLASCNSLQSPDMWMVEIEDSFKTQVLFGCAYLSGIDEELIDLSIDKVENLASEINDNSGLQADVAMYAQAMQQLAPTDDIVNAIYKEYQQTTLNFSEFTACPDEGEFSVWKSTELETNIDVTFKINKLLQWEVIIDEEDFTNYLMKLLEASI